VRQHFFREVFWPYWSIFRTGEFHNFTYDLTDASLRYLAETISVVTAKPAIEIEGYIREAINDEDVAARLRSMMKRGKRSGASQSVAMPFGRRLGWDAIARATRPKVIVETGVERGHGSVLLEAREYRIIAGKLAADAIILGDNAHATDKLARFARERGQFLFFKEVPKNHWYSGAGIGIAYGLKA